MKLEKHFECLYKNSILWLIFINRNLNNKTMSALSNLMDYIKKGKKREEVPQGICPNCWGRQEYGGAFYKAVKEENIDLNNIEAHKGWVQALASKYAYGIELKKKGDEYLCDQCVTKYIKE